MRELLLGLVIFCVVIIISFFIMSYGFNLSGSLAAIISILVAILAEVAYRAILTNGNS